MLREYELSHNYELHHGFLERALAKQRHQGKLYRLRDFGRSGVVDREYGNRGHAPASTNHGLSGEDGNTVEVDIDGRNHTEFDAVRIEQSAQGLRTYISS